MDKPKRGEFYRHWKGGIYQAITVAKHTERNEELVIYSDIPYTDIFARPLGMFNSEEWNGKKWVQRFERIPFEKVWKSRKKGESYSDHCQGTGDQGNR